MSPCGSKSNTVGHSAYGRASQSRSSDRARMVVNITQTHRQLKLNRTDLPLTIFEVALFH